MRRITLPRWKSYKIHLITCRKSNAQCLWLRDSIYGHLTGFDISYYQQTEKGHHRIEIRKIILKLNSLYTYIISYLTSLNS